MDDRSKKPLNLKNPTRHFDPTITKTRVRVQSPNSYSWQLSRQLGYQSRLYYEFKHCELLGGQTFYYTLTYSEEKCPRYYGHRCFDYYDLRHLLNGALTKFLLRNYGTQLKYFVGAELGDGKGKRGWHNNPHYHMLFFLKPAVNCDIPYKVIDPIEFRSLVRLYWQGYDVDYNVAGKMKEYLKYGICKEGENLGRVTDYRACSYVSKYVTKDASLKQREDSLLYRFKVEHFNKYYDSDQSKYDFYDYMTKYIDFDNGGFDDVVSIINYNLTQGFADAYLTFCKNASDDYSKERINEYRNRYSNKCRISQGVGEYALDFIDDPNNPYIPVPTKEGIENRPLNLYYYRKLYCDKVKDDKGNTMYVLNQKGIDYKVTQLPGRINKMVERVKSNLYLVRDKETYDEVYYSSINTDCWMKYDEIQTFINNVGYKKLNEIIKKYAEYKLVYEDRFLKLEDDRFPSIDVIGDYRRFITPIVDKVKPSRFDLTLFLEDPGEGYLAYYSHPYFLQYARLFTLFDLISDYSFIKQDNKWQKESEERRKIKNFHLGLEYSYK